MVRMRTTAIRHGGRRRGGLATRLMAAALLTVPPAILADADAEARAAIERLHGALVDVAAIEPAPDLAERYAALAPVIAETHDLASMSRFTVRRHWRDWTEAERTAFVEAFTRLSITTYASRFASIAPENFEILGSEPEGDDRVRVRALIHRREGDPVTLDYLLEDSDAGYRIVMVFNDDVSELSMKRSEYDEILATGDLDDLIAELEVQIDALL